MAAQVAHVVVVGAGLSGLTAARDMSSKGLKVVVLEAAGRVGGRTFTPAVGTGDGCRADLGGQWFTTHSCLLTSCGGYRHQTAVLDVAKELGVELYPQFCSGRHVLELDGKVTTYSGTIPKGLGLAALIDMQQLMWRLDRLAASISASDPASNARAKRFDGMTCATAARELCWTETGRTMFAAVVQGMLGVDPEDVSFLHCLNYVASSKQGIENMVTFGQGLQEFTFRGGAQQLSEKLAAKVNAKDGCRVLLNHPVAEVRQGEHGVTVQCRGGQTFLCHRVVVAMPPASASKITWLPGLPYMREQLNQRSFMGCIIKVHVAYKTAFWRDDGFSGQVVSARSGPVFNAVDGCFLRPDGSTQPALVGFINGDVGRQWCIKSPEERRRAVLAQFATWFGAKAGQPQHYEEKNWAEDPWTRGCPVSVWGTGALWASGAALRRPSGRIHWAGTESACEGQGFMDGAVRAGHRAATEVLAVVQAGRPVPPPGAGDALADYGRLDTTVYGHAPQRNPRNLLRTLLVAALVVALACFVARFAGLGTR